MASIEEEAIKYAKEVWADFGGSGDDIISDDMAIPFIAGANWALANQWRSVKDELPDYGVIVIGYNGFTTILTERTHGLNKDKNDFMIISFSYPIIYWMPIPPLFK
jgi:hypothetical protein